MSEKQQLASRWQNLLSGAINTPYAAQKDGMRWDLAYVGVITRATVMTEYNTDGE